MSPTVLLKTMLPVSVVWPARASTSTPPPRFPGVVELPLMVLLLSVTVALPLMSMAPPPRPLPVVLLPLKVLFSMVPVLLREMASPKLRAVLLTKLLCRTVRVPPPKLPTAPPMSSVVLFSKWVVCSVTLSPRFSNAPLSMAALAPAKVRLLMTTVI